MQPLLIIIICSLYMPVFTQTRNTVVIYTVGVSGYARVHTNKTKQQDQYASNTVVHGYGGCLRR